MKIKLKKENKIYFDYAATTPVDSEVLKAMAPYFSQKFGNPSSLHSFGQIAMATVDEAREKIAKNIGADFKEIIFTGSATEANNLALRGIIKATHQITRPRIITSLIEHPSIFETARDLENQGAEVIYLPVDQQGLVDLKKLKSLLNEQTVLVSIMYANNEIGTLQLIKEIAKIIKDFKKEKNSIYPLFHTDAVQAFQFLDCDVKKIGVDLMTLSAHKIYGPKGIGLLYSKSQIIKPIITGGSQEFNLRSGTENVPAIVGFAKAIELIQKESEKILELTNYFWQGLRKINQKIEINGLDPRLRGDDNIKHLPNILNVNFPHHSAQELLMKLDLNGVAVSSGSACSARAAKPSHVLKAIGLPEYKIKNSIRFSFGKFTTKEEILKSLKILDKILR